MRILKYHCIKTHKGKYGIFYAGKVYSEVLRLQTDIVYVHYYEEDMFDYNNPNFKNSTAYKVMPGLKFTTSKTEYTDRFLYFYDYFSDIKSLRREKLKKLSK